MSVLYLLQHPVTSRCRVRKQVGSTNRWRLPESLGSDLLGNSQAIKAVSLSYNDTMIRLITGKSYRENIVTLSYNDNMIQVSTGCREIIDRFYCQSVIQ